MIASPDQPPDVSVVIGTYNGARFLRAQLETVLGQSLPPLEVVVTDDGSTDDTLGIVEDAARASSVPVRLLRNEVTLGFADNFLSGARAARGRYVAFCDQDDLWAPDKLERCRASLRLHGALLAVHAIDLIDDRGVRLVSEDQGIDVDRVVEPLTASPWTDYFGFTMVVERALLELLPAGARGPDTDRPQAPLSHDRWVWVLASSLGRVTLLAAELASYRRHDAQLFGTSRGRVGWLRDRTSWLRHVARGLGRAPERADFLAGVCEQRARLLEGVDRGAAADLGVDDGALARAALRWRVLAGHQRARGALHASRAPWRGLARVPGLVLRGVYAPPELGGAGPRFLVQDLLVVLTGPLLRMPLLLRGPMTRPRR